MGIPAAKPAEAREQRPVLEFLVDDRAPRSFCEEFNRENQEKIERRRCVKKNGLFWRGTANRIEFWADDFREYAVRLMEQHNLEIPF